MIIVGGNEGKRQGKISLTIQMPLPDLTSIETIYSTAKKLFLGRGKGSDRKIQSVALFLVKC